MELCRPTCSAADRRHVHYLSLFSCDHSGCAVKGMTCLRPLEHWDRGFESNSRQGYVFMFILCLCQIASLPQDDSPQGVLATFLDEETEA